LNCKERPTSLNHFMLLWAGQVWCCDILIIEWFGWFQAERKWRKMSAIKLRWTCLKIHGFYTKDRYGVAWISAIIIGLYDSFSKWARNFSITLAWRFFMAYKDRRWYRIFLFKPPKGSVFVCKLADFPSKSKLYESFQKYRL